jgi:hypothetical protein
VNFLKSILVAVSAIVLVACGGGSDSPSTGAIDKYVGTWVSNCDSLRERNYVTITKASDTVLNYSIEYRQWSDAGCTTGMSVLPDSATGTLTFTGTKTVGADTVDKYVQVVVGVGVIQSGTFNEIVKFSGASFQLGDSEGVLDSEQYPTALDPSEIYFKQ